MGFSPDRCRVCILQEARIIDHHTATGVSEGFLHAVTHLLTETLLLPAFLIEYLILGAEVFFQHATHGACGGFHARHRALELCAKGIHHETQETHSRGNHQEAAGGRRDHLRRQECRGGSQADRRERAYLAPTTNVNPQLMVLGMTDTALRSAGVITSAS